MANATMNMFRKTEMTKMDVAETLDALERTRDDATKSKESALAYLQKLGVVDKTGKLSKRYRTSKTKNAA